MACKLTPQLFSFLNVDLMGFFLRIISPKHDKLVIVSYPSLKLAISSELNTFKSSPFSVLGVGCVLRSSSLSYIAEAIICLLPINVVNYPRRMVSSNVKPGKPVGCILPSMNLNMNISSVVGGSSLAPYYGCLERAASRGYPRKVAGFRVVAKNAFQVVLSYHLASISLGKWGCKL